MRCAANRLNQNGSINRSFQRLQGFQEIISKTFEGTLESHPSNAPLKDISQTSLWTAPFKNTLKTLLETSNQTNEQTNEQTNTQTKGLPPYSRSNTNNVARAHLHATSHPHGVESAAAWYRHMACLCRPDPMLNLCCVATVGQLVGVLELPCPAPLVAWNKQTNQTDKQTNIQTNWLTKKTEGPKAFIMLFRTWQVPGVQRSQEEGKGGEGQGEEFQEGPSTISAQYTLLVFVVTAALKVNF